MARRGELTKQLAFRVTKDEDKMLSDVAEEDNMSKSDAVRQMIRSTYDARFGGKRPGGEIAPTVRGIIGDITSPRHLTAGNIAKRAELPLKTLMGVFEKMQRKGFLHRLDSLHGDHSDKDSTWESVVDGGRDGLIAATEKAGIPLDEALD